MNIFRAAYDSLPEEAKDLVMAELAQALLFRGWDAYEKLTLPGHSYAEVAVRKIAKVFSDNGKEQPEYT